MDKAISGSSFTLSVSNSKHYLILFILWPFLAFLTAIINYSQKEAKKVVFIFMIYYGLTFFIGWDSYFDAIHYGLLIRSYAELPFSDFFKIIGGLYTNTTLDIVSPLVTFIVSRFTSHHGVLFAVWTAIFGFFYLKSINFLHNRYQENPTWNALIIMAFFIMILPITTVSGVRMPIATWIFFYGAFHVILYRDARYLLLTLASSLVHWSFLSANVVLCIYFFVGNRNPLYLPITGLSFILPQLMAPVFESIALKLGGPFQNRYENYSNEEYILSIQESYEHASWFMIRKEFVFYYLILAIVLIHLIYGNLMKEKAERNLFSFLLLFLAFVNFGKVIPTFGGRYQMVFYLFATLYVFLFIVKLPGNRINILTWIGLFPMLLYAAVNFRIGSESINAWIFAPGLGLPLLAPGLSVADLLFN